jgi:hypothetical protein
MRKLKHREIERRIRQTIAELQWWLERDDDDTEHRTHAELVTTRANDQVDEAIRARDYDGDGRGGAELTHPERHADRLTRRPDLIHERMTRLVGTLSLGLDTAKASRSIAGTLITSQDQRDRAASSAVASAIGTAGTGHCSNCNTWVPGTRDDRLKAGRCEPCYRYCQDHHGNERPREQWGTEHQPTPTDTGPRPRHVL